MKKLEKNIGMFVCRINSFGGWRVRWDLNPGFSAPEADALIRARLRTPLLEKQTCFCDLKVWLFLDEFLVYPPRLLFA